MYANHRTQLSGQSLMPLPLGRIAAHYYLDYRTPAFFAEAFGGGGAATDRAQAPGSDGPSVPDLLRILAGAHEFDGRSMIWIVGRPLCERHIHRDLITWLA